MPSKPAPPSRSTAVEDYLEQILGLINTRMEHHVSSQTLQAIEALLSELGQNPKLVARLRSCAHAN